ncbi:MAG: hypothetical protein L0196_08630 [candidate division Zixibacteria bacterium]|nr:hypothetical protein [candidate division Zixibacteria bacterium]
MKKLMLVAIGVGLGMVLILGCAKKDESGQTPAPPVDTAQAVQPAAATYYCTMHPEVTSDKPGKCSKCGMDLIEKKAETK